MKRLLIIAALLLAVPTMAEEFRPMPSYIPPESNWKNTFPESKTVQPLSRWKYLGSNSDGPYFYDTQTMQPCSKIKTDKPLDYGFTTDTCQPGSSTLAKGYFFWYRTMDRKNTPGRPESAVVVCDRDTYIPESALEMAQSYFCRGKQPVAPSYQSFWPQ